MNLHTQIAWLFLLSIPVACIAWTFTHEEMFKEPREYCKNKNLHCKNIFHRKFFYLFTCEYCFSHYVTVMFIFLSNYKLLLNDWRGYIVAGFSIVWIANIYMSILGLLRQSLKKETAENKVLEKKKEFQIDLS